MATDLKLDPKRTAVLAMDLQNMIAAGVLSAQPDFMMRVSALLDAARQAGVPVIYVVVRFREGYPEVSPRNRMFSGLKETGRLLAGDAGTEIHPDVAPRPGEVVITKQRVGALNGTDLQTVLRAGDITTLVLTGIATSGVILSTTRLGADLDYDLVIAEDCVADSDPEVHEFLMKKILPRQAAIVRSEDVIQALKTG